MKALNRPDADMRCRAAQTIALAYRRGMKGLETTVETLVARAADSKEHPAVRLEAVKTLIQLDARQSGESFLLLAKSGSSEMREQVEPALARWESKSAIELWLERLGDPESRGRSLALAIAGLAKVREKRAALGLRQLAVSDRTAPSIRLDAARALGQLHGEGLEKDAERLAGKETLTGMSDRLAAALLLQTHTSNEAVKLLQKLAKDREPAVAAPAVARLIEIDPKLEVDHADRLLASADAKLRGLGVDVLRRVPWEKHVGPLGKRLDDVHPEVRGAARRALNELAVKHGLRAKVLAEATKVLGGKDWKGQEQAAILLADLDHKPAVDRLVELLASGRWEVFVTSAWVLRRLAVPESLPGVVTYLQSELPLFRAGKRRENRPDSALIYMIDHQLSQLNQLLGQQKYRPADAILRGFVPRMTNVISFESRAAAIWALGVFHEGKRDAELEKAALARLQDTNSMPPEDPRVRRMSAILLGRLGAKDSLEILRRFTVKFELTGDPVNDACNWAIARITGVAVPALKVVQRTPIDWFLTPR
jgi:HEAT repeat protein